MQLKVSGQNVCAPAEIRKKFGIASTWHAPDIKNPDTIPKGDMPEETIKIFDHHIKKAQILFPKLLEHLLPLLNEHPFKRAVIGVHGGSGTGKSSISSLISYYLDNVNIYSYILSGDNYPHRIPKDNDAERLRVYRETGIKGLVSRGEYTAARKSILKKLQDNDNDTDPGQIKKHHWLSHYIAAGKNGLKNYIGTADEMDFDELNSIISRFKNGTDTIQLKRMGRKENELWYDSIDFRNIMVLIIEWTHGNNANLMGIDIPILLNSTPQETLEHRKHRGRDTATDSPFTEMILAIEQEQLSSQAHKAKIIITNKGEIISYDEYVKMSM